LMAMTCKVAFGLTLRAPVRNALMLDETDGTGNDAT
jgi:hypothetical protein